MRTDEQLLKLVAADIVGGAGIGILISALLPGELNLGLSIVVAAAIGIVVGSVINLIAQRRRG